MGDGEKGGVGRVAALFDESCAAFGRLVANADEAADAMDFTGKLHDLSLSAGRVLGLSEALAAFTGSGEWHDRAAAVLREYLGASGAHDDTAGAGQSDTGNGRTPGL